jgi:2-phosphosulfolactate phosphatase
MRGMIFDQSEYDVRCEWGERGVSILAPISDVVIVVDVLSFSTALDIATGRNALVHPYRWHDETVHEFAASVGAEVAGKSNSNGHSLSPSSLVDLPFGTRLVLPSPNGSTLSLLAGPTPILAGCLRNCRAVAESAMKKGQKISVIPAGEKWEDGSLRPCLEDLLGAGAVISQLRGRTSPEAAAAVGAFANAAPNMVERLAGCGSGKEKIHRGEENDIKLAAGINVSTCVPVLHNGAFEREA